MHGFDDLSRPAEPSLANGPWYREMNRYHWFVLVVAALGWLFDCLDQQLFVLARPTAMRDLLPTTADPKEYAGYATAIFLAAAIPALVLLQGIAKPETASFGEPA